MNKNNDLAINGGMPIRSKPMPPRHLIDIEERKMVLEVLDESIKTGEAFRYSGKYERKYEKEFVDFMGGDGFADGVNSGTNALFVAIGALELEPQSEVIVPCITDVGGVTPVIYNYLVPVFCDVDPRSYNISAEQISPLITNKTKAIIVAHISGEPADIEPIAKLAKENNLLLIEDCSQSPGAAINGKKVGLFGNIAIFSTMSSKHHCTGGQGGVVFSRNKNLIENSRQIADRGKLFINDKFTGNNIKLGLNCNMDELSASIGCAQIKKLSGIIKKTNSIGEKIKRYLDVKSNIMNVGWQPDNSFSVYWFIRIRLNQDKIKVSKGEFCKALAAEGFPLSAEYRSVPMEQECFINDRLYSYIIKNSESPDSLKAQFPNLEKSLDSHFNIFIRESFDCKAVDDILQALTKVEKAYCVN